MRARAATSIVLLALLLLVALANAGSTAPTDQARRLAARRAAAHPAAGVAPNSPADLFTINDGFVSKTYAHLGNPALGVLVAETWGETGWADAGGGLVEPNDSQGVVRALKQRSVVRVAVRVQLWGTDEAGDHQLASSSTVNSGSSLHAQVATPEVDVRTAPCLLWTRVFVAIRWSDNRLSNLSFDMPIGYFNLDTHCLAPPPPPPTTTTTTIP
jgi:hypothetical protein